MRSLITYIKLSNFKSFVGHVTVGPLKDFTVFVGSNIVGKHDLMDAVDFVFGVYNTDDNAGTIGVPISVERQLEHTWVSVVIARSDDDSNNITFERRLLPDEGGNNASSVSEYTVNGRVVELAEYQNKLRQMYVRPHAVPVILEASALLSLFGATAMQRLSQFEQFCGSDEFVEICRISEERVNSEEQKRLQQRSQLATIVQQMKKAHRRAEAYTKMKLKLKNLRIMSYHLDLWFLVHNIDDSANDLNDARKKLAKVDESICRTRRDHSECRRDINVSKTNLSSLELNVLPAIDEPNTLLDPKRMLAIHQQNWQHARHIAQFIDEQIRFVESLNQSTAPVSHQSGEQMDVFPTLTRTIAQPDQLTPAQQNMSKQLRATFNAKLQNRSKKFNEDLGRFQSHLCSESDASLQRAQQFRKDCNQLLSMCDSEREHMLSKLLQSNAVHHVFDVMNEVQTHPSSKAVSVALHDLVPTVVCDSTEAAEECNHVLRSEAATAAGHGISTLLVLSGAVDDGTTIVDSMPSTALLNRLSLLNVIRAAKTSAPIVGLHRYVAECVRAVLCDSQRQACATAAEHAVNSISENGVMFGARGDVCWLAEEGGQDAHDDDRDGGDVDNSINVLPELNVDDCAFDVNEMCNVLPADVDLGPPLANAMDRMAHHFQQAGAIEWCRSTSEVDRVRLLARLKSLGEMHESAIQPLTSQLDKLKRESMRRSHVEDIDSMAKQQSRIESTMILLTDQQTKLNQHVEQCHAKYEALRKDMHTLLLRLKKKNVPIPLQYGTLQDIGADDPNTQDAIQVDFGPLDHLIADNDATATARNRDDLTQLLQSTASEIQRRPNDRTIAETHNRLYTEHTALVRELKHTDRRLHSLRKVLADGFQRRTDRLRPFYEHIQRTLTEAYSRAYQDNEARAYLLPEDDNADGQHIQHALSEGILLDFMPPNRRFRAKTAWPVSEQMVAALTTMFTVYAYTRQPFVFVPQLDRLLAGAPDGLTKLVAELLAKQSERMQIVVCSDRSELFHSCDSVMGFISMDNGDSVPVLFNDE